MIGREALASYLAAVFRGSVEVLSLRRLKDEEGERGDDPKGRDSVTTTPPTAPGRRSMATRPITASPAT